jgi:maltose O-acetyltransferase
LVGDHTLFGSGVQILTPLHPTDAALRREREFGKPIEIGSDVWVGAGALILAGVHIQPTFAAGNPCRVVRELTQ